jgi:hypothetical protein
VYHRVPKKERLKAVNFLIFKARSGGLAERLMSCRSQSPFLLIVSREDDKQRG